MRKVVNFLTLLILLAAGDAAAATKTYAVADVLSVTGSQGGVYTYGISAPIVDHSLDGQTITIHSITVSAQGNADDVRVNFDWEFWFDTAPLGLTPGGAQTGTSYIDIAAATVPASYTTGWHFVNGNVVLPATGAFVLEGNYDFDADVGDGLPGYGTTSTAASAPMEITNGLYLQVAGWSGDQSTASGVDFSMSNITVTIDYTVVAPMVVTPVPTTNAWAAMLLTLLLAGAGWFRIHQPRRARQEHH